MMKKLKIDKYDLNTKPTKIQNLIDELERYKQIYGNMEICINKVRLSDYAHIAKNPMMQLIQDENGTLLLFSK